MRLFDHAGGRRRRRAAGGRIVFAVAQNGMLPINDGQIHDYLMSHPELVAGDEEAQASSRTTRRRPGPGRRMKKWAWRAFFDPRVAFVTGPPTPRTR